MQRRLSTHISFIIIILSIFTILAQLFIYSYFDFIIIIWGLSLIVSVLCCQVLLHYSCHYDTCFLYSFLTVFMSLLSTGITYLGKVDTVIPFTAVMIGLPVINWIGPLLYSCTHNLLDSSLKYEGFPGFFRNSSFLFGVFYLVIIIYGAFAADVAAWTDSGISDSLNLIPFTAISVIIENYMNHQIPFSEIFVYLGYRIFFFLPYGFYLSLLLRRQSRIIRFSSLLILPFLLELLQFFLVPAQCDIDDLIYAIIGGFIGSFCYYLTNSLYLFVTGRNFISRDNNLRYYNRSLHF